MAMLMIGNFLRSPMKGLRWSHIPAVLKVPCSTQWGEDTPLSSSAAWCLLGSSAVSWGLHQVTTQKVLPCSQLHSQACVWDGVQRSGWGWSKSAPARSGQAREQAGCKAPRGTCPAQTAEGPAGDHQPSCCHAQAHPLPPSLASWQLVCVPRTSSPSLSPT